MSSLPRVSHVEWCCRDLERARVFLEGLFGWRFEPYGVHYLLYTPAEGACVGLLQRDSVEPGQSPLAFIEVVDINATLSVAVDLGGHVLEGRTEIPGYGCYAKLTDPDGNIVGLFEALD